MLTSQLGTLPEIHSSALLAMLTVQLRRGQLSNPVGWLLSMLKLAREGKMVIPEKLAMPQHPQRQPSIHTSVDTPERPAALASAEQVSSVIADIRSKLFSRL